MPLPIREFSATIRPLLEGIGLKKRAGDYYTMEVASDFLGSVALGRATKGHELRIWPMIGLRHQPTERLVSSLLNRAFHPYSPATVLANVGYLMPRGRWTEWIVESETAAAPCASEIAQGVRDFGLPAMREHASLEALLSDLGSRREMTSPRKDYLLPVILTELGRDQEARVEIEQHLEARRHRTDPEAAIYGAFARRLIGGDLVAG